LSQENSAKDEIANKKLARFLPSTTNDAAMKLDDIAFTTYPTSQQTLQTPQNHHHIQFIQPDTKMEEIMLKNIWEIENNPLFSSGGASVEDELNEHDEQTPGSSYARALPG
jgi:hypothetical protein